MGILEIDEHNELRKLLAGTKFPAFGKKKLRRGRGYGEASPDIDEPDGTSASLSSMCQYSTSDGTKFFPAGTTTPFLSPGVYEIFCSNTSGIYFQKVSVNTDDLIRFPETNSEKVIAEIKVFWEREDAFRKHELSYKRGIILWGPPGSGKSCCIKLVSADIIEREGVVFKFGNPGLFAEGVRIFREIQANTPIVVLMEDLDSILECHNESDVLNLLDGVDQIDKVVYLATTNFPERLGGRILNRPSRFDKRHKMGHPKKKSRMLYFKHLIDEKTQKEYDIDLDKWVDDTHDMSIAHLKELFVAVCILGNTYSEAIATLKTMVEEQPDSSEDNSVHFGFDSVANGPS
jgi:hypothetical protein